jgi:hypothetical protein
VKNKEAYIQKLHAKIDEWNADIDGLKAKFASAIFLRIIFAILLPPPGFFLQVGFAERSDRAWLFPIEGDGQTKRKVQ